jgi:ribonuclease HI
MRADANLIFCSGPLKIYTDGSSLGNGKLGAVAGVGVYFGPNDPRYLPP